MIVHDKQPTAQSKHCTSSLPATTAELVHASCASWRGIGVLLTGPSGSGKSSLLLRLIDSGFALVGDDQILIAGNEARPAASLAGLIEVRGLGLVHMPHEACASIALRVHLTPGQPPTRLPPHEIDTRTTAWFITLDGFHADAVAITRTALRCISGDFALRCGVNGGTTHCIPSLATEKTGKLPF